MDRIPNTNSKCIVPENIGAELYRGLINPPTNSSGLYRNLLVNLTKFQVSYLHSGTALLLSKGLKRARFERNTGLMKRDRNPEMVQQVPSPRVESTQEKIIREFRAVKSAIQKTYTLPTTDKSIVQVRAPVLACYGVSTVYIYMRTDHISLQQ